MNLADTTDIIVGDIPSPRRNRIPFDYFDFHFVAKRACGLAANSGDIGYRKKDLRSR